MILTDLHWGITSIFMNLVKCREKVVFWHFCLNFGFFFVSSLLRPSSVFLCFILNFLLNLPWTVELPELFDVDFNPEGQNVLLTTVFFNKYGCIYLFTSSPSQFSLLLLTPLPLGGTIMHQSGTSWPSPLLLDNSFYFSEFELISSSHINRRAFPPSFIAVASVFWPCS